VATIEGRKLVAQSRPRRQIPKRHRSHQNAGSPRRLIDLVTSAHRFVMAGNGLTGQIAMSRRFTHSTASLANFRASRIELHYQPPFGHCRKRSPAVAIGPVAAHSCPGQAKTIGGKGLPSSLR
jgi:hypothetical protein